MITSQLLIFAVSALFRAIQQHMAFNQEKDMAVMELATKTRQMEHSARNGIRKLIAANPLFAWTTSILAILSFFFIVAFPMIGGYMGMPIHLGYIEMKEAWSFLFFGGGGGEDMMFKVLPGITILPFHMDLISAITGLFFGGLKRRRI